ncbi:DNA glycosylase AlkZ-like family protein [Corynebacterium flavescens]|uniref:DNA glycosylase AlkZ-like family protein n=1 Tax=Corynebacterium flavescens TaxID=28028 RepID=UPI00257EBDC7|nr:MULTISPECIES: crosslink repair DNA glycosylase YcaQ family protein [Corynebacterium]MDN6098670.1 winged helix DNA-binding domain-containing protein [Corynebacterium flavescens]MDN6431778.1 winged helix DNA-binding domain-containing protein [Corynebacterium flavescens]MDN6460459.1 winged helix DNA-binding domain-containing protein [Corynebacterium flavescens]MDN6475664.1 winged helix DNA-binding domain-containing protein [Corynebacterium flavescens]MDN6531851.1 winged helix DNA-binding domai
MDTSELLARRLISQGLAPTPAREGMRNGRDVAARLLALQAQNYPAGIRALGLRCGLDDAAITDEVRTLELVRSWPQRGTLHFLHAADVRWMSKLLYPRVANSQRGRRAALGLSEEMVTRARQALLEAVSSPLTRKEIYEVFSAAGIDPGDNRGSHLLRAFGGEGEVVQGPRRGAQEIFLRVDALGVEQFEPSDPFAELAARYVAGHGPVGVADLMAWSALSKSQALKAFASIDAVQVEAAGQLMWMPHWHRDVSAEDIQHALELRLGLPAFDEYLLGYANKDLVLPPHLRGDILTPNGLSWPWVMQGGVAVASLRGT